GGTGALFFLLLMGLALGTPVARAGAVCARRLARWKEVPVIGRQRLLAAGGVLVLVPAVLVLVPWELHLTSPCKLAAAAGAAGRGSEAQRRAEAARAEREAARSRVAEARAAVEAQSRIAVRLRGDTTRAARGDDPPAIAAARELWQQRTAEAKLAHNDCERIQL